MSHITRISRIPWTQRKNLLGCSPPPPLTWNRESVLTGGKRGQFDDAPANRSFPSLSEQQDRAHMEDANADMMEEKENDAAPNDATMVPFHFPGTSARAVATNHPTVTSAGDANTPLHKLNVACLTSGQPCRMGFLLLAAETAVSPFLHRQGEIKIEPSRDSSKHTTTSTISSSSSIMDPSISEPNNKAWHWYNFGNSNRSSNHSDSDVGTPLTSAERSGWYDGHDRNHLSPASHGYSANSSSSSSTEGPTNQDGEESDDSEEDEEEDQTVVVIRDGMAQYTVHRQPTPEKQSLMTTTLTRDASHDKQKVTFAERLVEIQEYKRIHGQVSRFTTRDKSLSRFVSNKRSDHRHGKLKPEKAARLRALGVPGFDEEDIFCTTQQRHSRTSPRTETSLPARAPVVAGTPRRMTRFSPRKSTSLESENDLLGTKQGISRPPGRLEGTSNRSSASPATVTADRLAPRQAKTAKKSSSSKRPFGKRGQSHLFVSWADRIVQLEEYRDVHGHAHVQATKHKTKDGELGRWLAAQRSLHKKRQLKPDRANDLRRMMCDGFV